MLLLCRIQELLITYWEVIISHSSDNNTCSVYNNRCLIINIIFYYLLERPPEVPINISVFIESNDETVDISITWDSAFNLLHDVSSYRVVASGGSAASCPSFCDPSGPCMCTGLGIGEDTTILITAINCGDQLGMPVEVTARSQGNHTQLKVNLMNMCQTIIYVQFHPDPQYAVFYLFILQPGILLLLI